MDWITGDRFQQIADFTFAPEDKCVTDYAKYDNTLDLELLKDYDIIYTQGFYDYKCQLINKIRSNKKVILITHNCDHCVDDRFILPDNVIKWYAQNVNIIDPRIESIPIGLECDRWFLEVRKKEKMIEKLKERKTCRNWIYMSFNILNARAKRQSVYDLFKDKEWVTNGIGEDSFDEYIDNIHKHAFVLCPEGNGIDTHRTWESLYMGTIPIEKRNINNQFYTDLPICFVNDWEEITVDFLENEFDKIVSKKWNIDKLKFEYWRNKICTR